MEKNFIPSQEAKNPKQEKWDIIAKSIEGSVDPSIQETVVAIQALDFTTPNSGEGGVNAPTLYPWVDIASKKAGEHAAVGGAYSNKNKLVFKKLKELEGTDKKYPDPSDDWYEDFAAASKGFREEREENKIAIAAFQKLLDEFYSAYMPIDDEAKLILSIAPTHMARLQPEGGRHRGRENWKKYDEKVAALNPVQKEILHEVYRDEMKAFTEFLKNKFFAE
jgi:hypothetical protein